MDNFIVEYSSSPISLDLESSDLYSLEKSELIEKIQELTQENQTLKRRLKELEEYSDISDKERLNSMGQELEVLRTKLNEKNQSISASKLEALKSYEPAPTSSTNGSESPKTDEKESDEKIVVIQEETFQTSPKSTGDQGRLSSTKSPSMVLMQQDAQYYAKMANREGARHSESRVWTKEILVAIKNKEPREKILGQIQHVIHDFIPKKARGEVWPILIGNPLRIKRSIYDQLCRSREACPVSDKVKNQIKEDLVRTYPELKSFNRGGALNDDLQHLLELFHFARPDIGYVQGISYPASILLLHMDNYHAFKCLMNLIVCRPFLTKLYKFEFDEIRIMCKIFEQLLKQRSPLVQKHLERMNITSEVFLIEWLVTLFCRNFHIDWTCKIWDLFLFEGEVALIKVALKILQMVESELVRRDYAETLYYIRGCTNKIDMEKLFRNVQNCQLTKEKLQKLMEKERKGKTDGVKNIFGSLFPKMIM